MDLLNQKQFAVRSHGAAAAYVGWLLRQFGAQVDHESALDPEGLGAFLGQGARFSRSPGLPATGGTPLVTDIPVTTANRAAVEAAAAGRPILWITPWGLDNAWEQRPWSDLVLCAAGGWMSAVGNPGEEPLAPPGPQPQFMTGLFAAIHALAALDGPGLSVVSMAESVAATMIYDSVAFQYLGAVRERVGHRFARTQPTLVILPCKDGFFGIQAALHHQFVALCRLIGHPDLVSDPRFASLPARIRNADDLDGYLRDWLATRTRFEAYHELEAARIPCSPLPDMAELLASPQLAARDSWQQVTTPAGHVYRVPGPPARIVATAGPAAAAPREDGPWEPGKLRVVDFSMGWAGPLVSHVLACYGADVIKLESHRRFDWWRGSRPPGDDPASALHERSHVFNTVNRGKRGLTLDLATPEGNALGRTLIATADVIIENFTAGVLPKLGLSYETLAAANPRLIMLRQPGFGTTGPEKDYLVFGNTIEGMSGLTSRIGYSPETYPFQMSNALGDPVSGLNGAIAVLAAVAARAEDGRGRCIEGAQLEGFIPFLGADLIAYQATGVIPVRSANARPGAALAGAFRTAGEEEWIAVEVTPAMTGALEGVIGGPIEGFASWTAAQEQQSACALLAAAGIAAAPVNSEADVLSREPFSGAAFFAGHERAIVGFHLYPSLPAQRDGSRPTSTSPAPMLGEHNAAILAGLGLNAAEVADLRERGIIGEVPA